MAPPQTQLGSVQCSPRPLAGFNGPTSKGRKDGKEGLGGEMGKRVREGRKGKAWRRTEGEGEGLRHGCWGMDTPGRLHIHR